MAFTDKAKNSIISIDKFHYAVLTANTASDYTHPAMTPIEGLIEIGFSYETAEGELYADGQKIYADSSTVGIDLTTSLASIKEVDRALIFGNTYTANSGSVKTTDIAPEICVAFRAQMRDGQYKYYKFNVATAQLGDTSMSTKTGDISYQTEEVIFKCLAKAEDKELYNFKTTDVADATFFNAVV